MKYGDDVRQGDLLGGFKRPVGRPNSGKGKTAAERQKARRERLRAAGVATLTVEVPADLLAGLDQFVKFKDITKDEVIVKLLRGQLLRKR